MTTKRRILVTGGSGFIGTHMVDKLKNDTTSVFINIDKTPPNDDAHKPYWHQIDILNYEDLAKVFSEYEPTDVIHLAARTDTDSDMIEDYTDNTVGTENVLKCVQNSLTVKRLIITSSQFVCKPGYLPKHDEDFSPHTAYGQSKVINEKQVRALDLQCIWSIIRPTNIWGAWHPRYPFEFWKVLEKRTYFHPSGYTPTRSYGYVKNIVDQIYCILNEKESFVDKKIFYLGDRPIRLIEWVDGFSIALTGKKARVIPRILIQVLGVIGDLLWIFKIKFPINSSRFKSMTTDYPVPMEPTLDLFGEPPYTMEEGIKETVYWLQANGFVKEVYV